MAYITNAVLLTIMLALVVCMFAAIDQDAQKNKDHTVEQIYGHN